MAAVPLARWTCRALTAHRAELRKALIIRIRLLDLLAIVDAGLRRNRQTYEQ
jgi:hypothetical protein